MRTVRDLLEPFKMIGPEHEWNYDEQKYVPTGEEIPYGCKSDAKRVLKNHLDDEVLHYIVMGPLVCFAIKLRGSKVAAFYVNSIDVEGWEINRSMERLMKINKYDAACAQLRKYQYEENESEEWPGLKVIARLE